MPPMAGVDGGATRGAAAGAAAVLRRLAALAMRRATEERAGLAEAGAALRLLALAAGLAAAARLRPAAALRATGAAFALVAGFVFAAALTAGLALAGLALTADRGERAFAGAAG